MQTWEWIVIVVILVGAVVFTLAWWKIADKWADQEHKRFGPSKPGAPTDRVVIRMPKPGEAPVPPEAPHATQSTPHLPQ